MNKLELMNKLPTNVAKNIGKFSLFWQRNGALILNATGMVSMLAATYFGIQAGRKIDKVVDAVKLTIDEANKTGDQKLIKKVKIQGARDICRCLGLPVGLAIGGAVLVTKGTLKQKQQVAGLAAAYCGILAEYEDLRQRAAESISEASKCVDGDGNEVKKDADISNIKENLQNGGKLVKSENYSDDNKELVFHFDLNSKYEFLFDSRSVHFKKNDIWGNISALAGWCKIVDIKYQAGIPVFLSDVLDMLDIEKTKASLVEGWWIKNPNTDGHVSFGIEPFIDGTANYKDYEFLNDGIPLRMNCDGPIAYMLKERDCDI